MNHIKEDSKMMWGQIQRGDWNAVRTALASDYGRKVIRRTHFNGVTVLASSIGYHPPVDVVRAMVDIHPNALITAGIRRRLPLHLACAFGASREVLEVLIEGNDSAATATDADGRTPLHYVVENFCHATESYFGNTDPRRLVTFEAVKVVLAAAPCAAHMRDEVNGETPFDFMCRLSHEMGYKYHNQGLTSRWCGNSASDAVSLKEMKCWLNRTRGKSSSSISKYAICILPHRRRQRATYEHLANVFAVAQHGGIAAL